ncbi:MULTISPECIES: hypothetical protein [unclassified Thermosynechococcus]|uniref:hypothetical protein n=1 Tax=unclassified Thermosynechococcus TaxID=2622553 RepID=UPI00197CDC23|nr:MULTISPECIES: hypothetical protein [unclassified Thermosynechococcus]QSF50368.1 hypothetical protein JW907_06410 [Thermosynechococcus sp. TA-1]WNC23496.1 hypothetical protein RHG98_06395 [Thermosynechococcus sp. PP22]WNC31279.1 hypothetical protein RHH81_06400 [Thermosynechococcus sp. PKX95]WNC33803.1 hypothetical protein RHH79_06395 [Thermosynechococcus sp. PKX91]WNC36328.1 hypothetical protein RHI11_06400 [Thermosynechococcus sp. WL11]
MVAQILAALLIGLEQAQGVPTWLSQTPRSDVYRVCRIFNGRLSYCGRWFTGETVLLQNNFYRTCRIFNGRLSYCGCWFTGETVLLQNNFYRTCRIFNGRLSDCGRWFTGEAVLSEPRR